MIKFLIAILIGCAVYLSISPTCNLTIGSYIFISVSLGFFLALIGMPTYLILNRWLAKDIFAYYSLKILISVALAFLLPVALFRWFRNYMAKSSNLTQLGEMAMFKNGELTESGRIIVLQDFMALSLAALVVTLIISATWYLQKK